MANVLKETWVLDTTGTIYLGQVKITQIVWKQPTTLGHTLLIRNKDDQTILEATAEANNQTQVYYLDKWFTGVKLVTLDSGKVIMYIE